MLRRFTLALTLVLPLTAQGDVIAVDSFMGDTYSIETWNGGYALLGSSNFLWLSGLAKVGGTLMSVDSSGTLVTIDPVTGAGTAGPTISPSGTVRGLATHPTTGALYAILDGGPGLADELVILDPVTGAATPVGSTGVVSLTAFAIDPAGVGFAWDAGNGLGSGQGLVTIDLATAASTDVNPAIGNTNLVTALAFSGSGQLWGAFQGLWLIDAATGAVIGPRGYISGVVLTGFVFPSDATATTYGAGCPGIGGVPTISTTTAPALGTTYTFRVDTVAATNFAFVAAGFSDTTSVLGPLPINLQAFGLAPGCELLTSGEIISLVPVITNGSSVGYFTFYLAVPSNPAFAGTNLFFQAASIDSLAPGGLAVSNGLATTIR